jgi:alpha-amylase
VFINKFLVYAKNNDKVVVGLDLPIGQKEISVGKIFENGTLLMDAYSGKVTGVFDGKVKIDSPYSIILLEISKETEIKDVKTHFKYE